MDEARKKILRERLDALNEEKQRLLHRARAINGEIDEVTDELNERCLGYDEGGFRCELKRGHEGDHFVEYMGG